MQNTPRWNLPYPESTDNTQLWTYFQQLANAVDNIAPFTAADWDPVCTQAENIGLPTGLASTADEASCRYVQMGKIVWAMAGVTLTAAGSQGIGISLPVPAAAVSLAPGAGRILASPAITQSGTVRMLTTEKVGFTDAANGFVAAAPSGAQLTYSLLYIAA